MPNKVPATTTPPVTDFSSATNAFWTASLRMRRITRSNGAISPTIVVERTYADFESYWRVAQTGPRLAASIAAMASADRKTLSDRLRARLGANAQGRITLSARANAIKGRVPG